MWLSGDRITRIPGYVSVGSRRYAEWQNLAYQATTDEISEAGTNQQITEPMVERPEYVTPTAILPRPVKAIHNVKIAGNGDASPPSIECTSGQGKIDPANSNNLRTMVAADIGDPTMDDEVRIKEGGSIFAEDVEDQMAVLPEFREKLHQLIKGLLSARMIRHSTSPWASSIVVIIKKNGIDIRLCIDYRLVNSLTRLMVYPMPLINDLLDDLDKVLWYCSLDMASGFWWNLSISIAKSFWGQQKVDYLGHRVSAEGLETHPKDQSALQELPFPSNLRSMQSFLGSLNYYSRFIEDFAIYASVLYKLREADFYEIARKIKSTGDDESVATEEGNTWTEARTAFATLKNKIVNAPILQHFDVDRQPVVVVYASKWAISAALMQEHDGVYKPVTFTSRTLKPNEINYGMVDKEVLALLRILDICYTQLVTRSIKVLTRYSTLAWLLHSSGLQGRTMCCTSIKLDPRDRQMYQRGGRDLRRDRAIAASITPRKEVDSILISIAPRKQPRQVISMPPPTVEPDERLLVVSFDGSARVKRRGGAYSGIVWNLPEWTVISAASKYKLDLTVNEAEYHGLLLCLDLLSDMDRGRLIICGDSNLMIRQMKGEIERKPPGLTLLRQQALERLRSWPNHEFLHMKRDWNQSADSLASAALRRESGVVIVTEEERQDLVTLNRLDELLIAKDEAATVKISAVTRSRKKCRPQVLQEEIVQRMRIERINRAQDEEKWIVDLKAYLRGDVQDLNSTEAKNCSKIAERYETDESGLLFYFPPTKQSDEDRDLVAKLAVPETLQNDLMHHYHSSLEGGRQGIGRTYHKIRAHFHWRGLYQSVQRYVGQCIDCETGKGRPTIHGESSGNLQATYPFQIIGMDHIPSLPRSYKGNGELLIWIDLFTGYVIAKASASRTAQTVAENYEECVFRRFGASEAIRHDREPGFMSDFFRSFNKIVGQRQRATMAYRPQANGTTERMVGTLTRAVKMYVEDIDQRDWDEYAERLTFALNIAQDRVRGDTPFYLLHGWDPRSTLEAMVPLGSTRRRDREPRRWRYRIQKNKLESRLTRNYEMQSKKGQIDTMKLSYHIRSKLEPKYRVKEGYARKLAHMWHGSFRVLELVGEHAVRLEIAGTEYRLFPVVHVSKIKPIVPRRG
ncbi:LOW QUALITY PROTEIN: Reverse transcriptase [Phytophthora palmivora]|uniref:Reverse transcriptase n=1 Tax=Phytophthora palmivora TaxID=4796 RepID=A0A2P4XT51_9STRA|nr:LOW QUALITY PROTEIN: Reverse transcriptase [Phytophthora palmivora]